MANIQRIGLNIVCISDKYNSIFLEWDYNNTCFDFHSDYEITKKFFYNDRQYKRDNPNNFSKYKALLEYFQQDIINAEAEYVIPMSL